MKVIIIGAGRMGIRHAIGALSVLEVNEVILLDTSENSINKAKQQLQVLENYSKISLMMLNDFVPISAQVVIIATTADNRIATCKLALSCRPKCILIEKPLGQSFQEVTDLASLFSKSNIYVCVNLNMRLYPFFQQLKDDMANWTQFSGDKTIVFNGGALGIGANGIHYLDLIIYLLNADNAELIAGEIEPFLIPSGRGSNFGDFGGWAVIGYYNKGEYIGKAILSLSSSSTVLGGWDIIGPHARVRINEIEGLRINIVRDPKSDMPINRYAADYLSPEQVQIETPFLGDLTKYWIEMEIKGIHVLPEISETLKVHKLLFDWLELSGQNSKIFPIT